MEGHEKASNFAINRKKKKNLSKEFTFLAQDLFYFFILAFAIFQALNLFTQQEKSLLVLRFLQDLRALGGSSWPFFFLSLEFLNLSFLLFLQYFLPFQCFQVAGSLEFCFIGFSTLAIYASDCLTKFSVNYFLCENCEENLLTRSFLDIYIAFFFLLQFFTHCHAIPYKPSNKAAGEVKHYHNLVLTDPGVLGISIASAL